jgi:hypothetical protein
VTTKRPATTLTWRMDIICLLPNMLKQRQSIKQNNMTSTEFD